MTVLAENLSEKMTYVRMYALTYAQKYIWIGFANMNALMQAHT